MKPWPSKILERYPLDPTRERVPERPWWYRSESSGLLQRRSEIPNACSAITIRLYMPHFDTSDRHAAVEYPDPEGIVNVIYGPRGSRDDTQMPMATDEDVLVLLERIDRERPLPHPGYRVGQIWAEEEKGMPTLLGGGHITRTADPELKRYCYLVSDQACPHLAPWSPS